MRFRVRTSLASLAIGAAVLLGVGCDDDDNVTTPTLAATCEARPSSGRAPLTLSFVVGVTGADGPAAVSIAYGDGSSGTNPDAPHTYAAAGTYVASFAVTTSTQSARCSATVTVEAPAPPANQPPSLVAKTTPSAGGPGADRITGTAPLAVHFNLCTTSDPEDDLLYFLFDFDGDGRYDAGGSSGANCRKDWTYNVGTWKPEVCVHDRDAAGKPLHDDQCKTYVVTATP
jgi:hypothetical protein